MRQSFIRLFLKNSFCPAVREFWNTPVYESLIFSYHFSLPTAFLRLNGAVCDIVSVILGNYTVSVESDERCEILADVDKLHFEFGNLYVMLTLLLVVFSVNELL